MKKIQIAILHNMPEADGTLSGVRGVKKHNIPVFLQMPQAGVAESWTSGADNPDLLGRREGRPVIGCGHRSR
jgi:hypothetical protein